MTRPTWLRSVFRALTGPTQSRELRVARRTKVASLPAEIRLLEARTLLSGLVAEPQTTTAALSPVYAEEINSGAVITRTRTDASQARLVVTGEGSLRPDAQLNGSGLQFNLVAASGMSQQAIDGFQAAADLWSSILRDDILVNIDIDFTALSPGVLGSTGSTSQGNSFSSVKTALTNDTKSLSDATAVANLPAGSSLSIYTSDATTGAAELDNNGTANNNTLDINTANAKALGLRTANNAASDGSITFSNLFTWDFDRSDGIASGAYDFVGVAAHEIGHLLGFVSGADTVDYFSHNGSGAPLELDPYRVVTTLDLFRYSAASESAGANLDLRADTATKYFSVDGGTTQLTTYSTGSENGDGRQCSHWKDNLNIGIMDPTAANGEYTDITNLDVQAFDVIGWDLAMDQGDSPDTGSGTGAGNYATNLSDNGPRHMLFSASGSISDPSGAPKVYLGAGVTGELSALQNGAATGDADNGIASLPTLIPGSTQNFTVTSTGNNAVLNYFFDFNNNGSFTDAGESFTTTLTTTSQSVSVTVPAGATVGTTFARFRISTAGGLTSVGAANDGEVEDYQVTVNSPNTAPTLGGSVSNQAVNDTATISPFSTLTVTDPDTQSMSAIVRINNGIVRGDFSSASTVGWNRTVNGNDIQYARTFSAGADIGSTVQAAIRGFSFQPRANAIKPNTTETTTFNITVTDGVASPAINGATSVVTTSVNDAPSFSGVTPAVSVNDNATVQPFTTLAVTDADNQEMLAKVTIRNGVVRGDFTNAVSAGWTRSVVGNDINYQRYFSPGANIGGTVQAAFRALVFQPRNNAIRPGTTEAADFLISISDGVATPISDSSTRVTTTSINNLPVISGASASITVNDTASVLPLAALTVSDADNQESLAKVTILNGVVRGDFTNAIENGWTRSVVGNDISYVRYFNAGSNIGGTVQAAYRALVFRPRMNAINPGTTEATDFLVSVNDGLAIGTDSGTRVTTTSVNDAPILSGAVADQTMDHNTTKAVFGAVTVVDPDNQAEFVRVTIPNGTNRGDFTSASATGWTRSVNGIDIVYTRYFNPASNNGAAVQTALRALVFQPRSSVPVGTLETTTFTVFVNDGLANTTNSTTSVIVTGVALRPTAINAAILDQDVATVVVPATKPIAPSLLSRLLKRPR